MAERNIVNMSEAPEVARRYADYLSRELRVLEVYLFGSYTTGVNHKDSDIDIAVVSDSFTGDPIDDLATLLVLKSNIDNRIEPHPFLPEEFTRDNPIAKEIINTGIRIA